MRENLLSAYQKIRDNMGNEPAWAVHRCDDPTQLVHCTIPFIGKEYANQEFKILLYASAENLSGYDGYLDAASIADDRHRWCYNQWQKAATDVEKFYPDVHLQPVTDGPLLLAVYYIASQLSPQYGQNMEPAAFMEKIAFGNYGKYSIEGARNKDYARVKGKLAMSHSYIEQDVSILQPDLIILPRTILNTDYRFISSLQGLTPKPLHFCGIMQLNRRTLSSNIPNQCRKLGLQPKEYADLSESILAWSQKVKGARTENLRWLVTHLDAAMEEMKRGDIGG